MGKPAIWAVMVLVALSAPLVRGNLVINPTYSFDSAQTADQQAQYQAGFEAAIAEVEGLFANNVAINVTFATTPGTSTFGHSNYSVHNTYSYSQITTALSNHATTAADGSAVANFGSDPTGGGNFVVNDANAKILGLRTANSLNDGTVTIGDGNTFTFDPNNRAVAGKYDFIGIVEHEITEVMGRAQGLGASFGSGAFASVYEPFDLFRYTSSGVHSVIKTSGVYFSVDGGATNLKGFYGSSNGDYSDWSNTGPDSFNAFSNSGVKNAFTPVDVTVMDVLGYTPAPEPTLGVIAPLVAFAMRRGRRR